MVSPGSLWMEIDAIDASDDDCRSGVGLPTAKKRWVKIPKIPMSADTSHNYHDILIYKYNYNHINYKLSYPQTCNRHTEDPHCVDGLRITNRTKRYLFWMGGGLVGCLLPLSTSTSCITCCLLVLMVRDCLLEASSDHRPDSIARPYVRQTIQGKQCANISAIATHKQQ